MSRDASEKALQKIQEEYKDVFANKLGVIHPFKAKLSVDNNAKPKFIEPDRSLSLLKQEWKKL